MDYSNMPLSSYRDHRRGPCLWCSSSKSSTMWRMVDSSGMSLYICSLTFSCYCCCTSDFLYPSLSSSLPHWHLSVPLLPLFSVCVCVPGTSERKARHLYYSDLRERVLRSECRQQEEVYFQLAGYALQADLGDHQQTRADTEVTPYFEPKEYFPPWVGVTLRQQHLTTLLNNLDL